MDNTKETKLCPACGNPKNPEPSFCSNSFHLDTKEGEKKVVDWKTVFRPPFYYDQGAQTILDANGGMCLDVRGWGRAQQKPHGELLQDSFGMFVAHLLNKAVSEFTPSETIDFATWYSGMEKEKVETAYQRYVKEKLK